jgi:hypothetical protein
MYMDYHWTIENEGMKQGTLPFLPRNHRLKAFVAHKTRKDSSLQKEINLNNVKIPANPFYKFMQWEMTISYYLNRRGYAWQQFTSFAQQTQRYIVL